jgi:hypothetical protein
METQKTFRGIPPKFKSGTKTMPNHIKEVIEEINDWKTVLFALLLIRILGIAHSHFEVTNQKKGVTCDIGTKLPATEPIKSVQGTIN